VKNLAFVLALLILAIGAVGLLVPSSLVWIAHHTVTSSAFYVIATVRVAFGLVLIAAAPNSRVPKAVRVLGYLILVAGIATALMGLMAMDLARAIIEWWLEQGPGFVRVSGLPVLALGGFIAYACAPSHLDRQYLGR
jgi:hypothetical protein